MWKKLERRARAYGDEELLKNQIAGEIYGISGNMVDLFPIGSKIGPGDYVSDYSSEMLAQVGLIMFKDDMAGNYSRGMIQRLGFAIAIAHSPTTLLLDEPFTGLDDEGSQIIEEHLLRLKENDCSILLSSHDDISFTDRTLELDQGAIK